MWYTKTNNTKIAPNNEKVFQIRYNDGTLGGFIGDRVRLPSKKCFIDEKSILFGDTALSGKFTIKNAKIGDSSITVFRSATITDSRIDDSFVDVTRFELKASTVNRICAKGSGTALKNTVLKITRGSNIVGFKDTEKTKFFLFGNSEIAIKQSAVDGKNIVFEASDGKMYIDSSAVLYGCMRICRDLVSEDETHTIKVSGYASLYVKKSKIFNFRIVANYANFCEINNSTVAGELTLFGGNLYKSNSFGLVNVSGYVTMESTVVTEKAKIDMLECAAIIDNENSSLYLDNADVFDNAIIKHMGDSSAVTKVSICRSTIKESAKIVFENNLSILESRLLGNSFTYCFRSGNISYSIISGNSVVYANAVCNSNIDGNASIGCLLNSRPIENAKNISVFSRNIVNRYDAINLDYEKRALIFFSDGTFSSFSKENTVNNVKIENALSDTIKKLSTMSRQKALLFYDIQSKIETKANTVFEQINNPDIKKHSIATAISFAIYDVLIAITEKKKLTKEQKRIYKDIETFEKIDISKGVLISREQLADYSIIKSLLSNIAST